MTELLTTHRASRPHRSGEELPLAQAQHNVASFMVSALKTAVAENTRLEHEKDYDFMTGFVRKEVIKANLAKRVEEGKPTGVLSLDFDAFKEVNDTIGHQNGDKLLERFGEFCRANFRRTGDQLARAGRVDEEGPFMLGRMGGDEFLILVDLTPDVESGDRRGTDIYENMDKVQAYARGVFDAFVAEQPEEVRSLGFNISAGEAIFDPANPMDAETLLKWADDSMYEDKHTHGGGR